MGLGLIVSHPTEQPVAHRNARLLRNALCQQATLVISPGTQTVGVQGNRQQIIYSLKETRQEQFMRQHLSHLPADFLTAIVFHTGQYMGNFPSTGIIKQSRRPLYRETPPENLFHFIARCIS